MKKIGLLVAMLALISGASVAQAADHAWFTLESFSGTGTVEVTESGPNHALKITKTGDAVLTIGFRFTNTFAPGMNSWAIGLNAVTVGGGTGVFQNGAYAAANTGYDNNVGGIVNGSTGFDVGRTASAGTGAAGLAYTFQIDVLGKTNNTIVSVYGDFGGAEQFYAPTTSGNPAYAWYGFVGPNPISYGRVGYVGADDETPGWGSHPVIIITNVPEPATLGLIGLGVVALIRRRR